MGWLFGGLGLTLLLAGLLYRYILFPAFPSPLAKLPLAHPLCAISATWLWCQSARGRELRSLYTAHKRHGPIVRLAPSEVSVVSQEGLRQVYVRGLDKDVWYQQAFYNYGVQNLVSTLDHKTHHRNVSAKKPRFSPPSAIHLPALIICHHLRLSTSVFLVSRFSLAADRSNDWRCCGGAAIQRRVSGPRGQE